MNLNSIDWLIVIGFFAALGAVALFTRRYTRSVSDFLAGNRCAGRYLLTMSEGLAGLGLVGTIANFEKFYNAGFAASWWGTMMAPIALVIALTGWVSYRYRQTRAMTMAQFFEMRYSRRFRIFAGVLAFVSGVLNFGIFPGIVARFIVYFCGLPDTFDALGLTISTFAAVMATMLAVTLVLTLSGGMVTVMITDFLQAQFVNIVFVVVMIVLFSQFAWSDVTTTLEARPADKSLVNPFDQEGIADFNIFFFLIFAFKIVYNRLGWQGSQGYNCAAKSPHEARMAGILAEWRGGVTYLIIMLMPICAYVLLHNPQHAAEAASIQTTINGIADPQIQKQMTVPVSLVHMLPIGVVGLLCAAMIAATIGNDTTYLHAWGSIFIQDVLMPLRKKPLSTVQHLNVLRLSVVGVAVFSFFFSLWFPLRDYVVMYQLLTGAIYLAGSGAVIIGGLYWSRGTTAGAWSALIAGCVLATVGVALRATWPAIPALAAYSEQFPINGAWLALIASLSAIAIYVVVSLLTCRQPFNMDKLLHRGAYADPTDTAAASLESPASIAGTSPAASSRLRWLGITDEFTRGDRAIYFLKMGWTAFWFAAFVLGTVVALTVGIPDSAWSRWWLFTIVLGGVVGAITVVWFLIGGMRDLFDLLRVLRDPTRDLSDDGSVHQTDALKTPGAVPARQPIAPPAAASPAIASPLPLNNPATN